MVVTDKAVPALTGSIQGDDLGDVARQVGKAVRERVLRQFFPRGHDGSPRREIRCWGNSSGAGRAPRQGSGREWECHARGC